MILDILNEVAATGSTKAKEAIIEKNKDNEVLKTLFKLAYSKQIMFGIKKFPVKTDENPDDPMPLKDALFLLEHVFATRETTGNAAIERLTQIVDGVTMADAEVLRRVILRDLEIGIGRTIANKVWKGLIPDQPQMLATPNSEKALKHIVYPAYAQLKADGARCFAEVRGDEVSDVKLLSRAGNEYIGLDLLKQQLILATAEARKTHPDGILIDGELVWEEVKPQIEPSLEHLFGDAEPLEELSKAKEFQVANRAASNGIANKSLKGTLSPLEADGMSYQVWDFVPLSAYAGVKSEKYETRFEHLSKAVKGHNRIILIENEEVQNIKEAKAISNKYIAQGLEGIILKNKAGLWEDRRSKNQVKFKAVISFDLEVFDSYPHKKDPNKLGGLWVRSKCGCIRTKVGSGFTDTTHIKNKKTKEWELIPLSERDPMDREYLWSIREELNGRILEGECNDWQTSETRKELWVALFLPIAVRFREDKDVANTFEEVFGEDFSVTGLI